MSPVKETALDTILGRTSISMRSHGIFLNITGPATSTVSGGMVFSKPGDLAVEGSVVWHDGVAVLTFGRPDVDGYFAGETHQLGIGDRWDGINAVNLLDKIAVYVNDSDELRQAVLGS